MKLRATLPLVFLGLGLASAVFAQQVSRKKDIAVFGLSYYQWDIPDSVLGAVDEEIQGVFINLGRFNVLGLTQRLEPGDLPSFIDAIRRYREERVELPQEVQMGREFFTQADFERLAGSFIVVVPSVASYVLEPWGSDFRVSLKTSFTFINVEQGRSFAQAFVESEGREWSPDGAARRAMDGIAPMLSYELRKIPEFQLRTGVLEVHGSEVVLELGRDMGVRVGDEYVLVSSRLLDSGRILSTETGLLVVKEVSDEVSIGQIIYARPRPQEGDQLRELPLFGVETTPYVHVAAGLMYDPGEITAMAGLRGSISRGFYGFRPIFALEVPFITNIIAAIPLNLYLGGEYLMHLGRLSVSPMAALGIGGAYLWYLHGSTEEEKFAFTNIGLKANIAVSYLFNKKMKLTADVGYVNMFSFVPLKYVNDVFFPDYDGLFVGAGLTIKL